MQTIILSYSVWRHLNNILCAVYFFLTEAAFIGYPRLILAVLRNALSILPPLLESASWKCVCCFWRRRLGGVRARVHPTAMQTQSCTNHSNKRNSAAKKVTTPAMGRRTLSTSLLKSIVEEASFFFTPPTRASFFPNHFPWPPMRFRESAWRGTRLPFDGLGGPAPKFARGILQECPLIGSEGERHRRKSKPLHPSPLPTAAWPTQMSRHNDHKLEMWNRSTWRRGGLEVVRFHTK